MTKPAVEKENLGILYATNQFDTEFRRVNDEILKVGRVMAEYQDTLVAEFSKYIRAHKEVRGYRKRRTESVPPHALRPMGHVSGKCYFMYLSQGKLYGMAREAVLMAEVQRTMRIMSQDYQDFVALIHSLVDGFLELAQAWRHLSEREHAQHLANHLQYELEGQTLHLNRLFGEFNSYSFLLFDAFEEERQALSYLAEHGEDNVELQERVMRYYRMLVDKRAMLNQLIGERQAAMMTVVQSIRKDMASVTIAEMASDVANRNERLREYKEEAMIEDIRDYEDLEGQYRHQYDEEGNLIEPEEVEEAQSNTAARIVAAVVVLGLLVFLGYKFMF